jgi:hypothetical protein
VTSHLVRTPRARFPRRREKFRDREIYPMARVAPEDRAAAPEPDAATNAPPAARGGARRRDARRANATRASPPPRAPPSPRTPRVARSPDDRHLARAIYPSPVVTRNQEKRGSGTPREKPAGLFFPPGARAFVSRRDSFSAARPLPAPSRSLTRPSPSLPPSSLPPSSLPASLLPPPPSLNNRAALRMAPRTSSASPPSALASPSPSTAP